MDGNPWVPATSDASEPAANPWIAPAVGATRAAVAQSPDQAASDEKLAKALGWPSAAVTTDRPGAQAAAASQSAASTSAQYPALATWLAQPGNAAVAHDHLDLLGTINDGLTTAFGSADLGVASAIRGLGEGSAALARLQGDPARAAAAQRETTQFLDPIAAYVAKKGQERTPANPTFAQQTEQAVGGIVPYVLSGALAPAMAALQGSDQVAQAAQAKGVSGTATDVATLGSGAAQAALMALPFGKLAENLVPAFKSELLTAAAKLGVGTAAQGGVGAGMQLATNVAEKAGVDPTTDLTKGLGENAATMALLHAVTAAPGVVGEMADRTQAAQATDAKTFNLTAAAVREAPLTARSPDRLRALVNEMAPGENVYLPGDAVRTYLQADGDVGPFVAAGVADQLGAAASTGADVVIPAADYLAHIAPTPAHDALQDDLRLAPDGLSAKEQDSFETDYASLLQDRGGELADQANAAAEAGAPMQRVFDDVHGQAREAGFSVDAARQYAALYAARYETRASRLNDGAEEPSTDAYQEFQRAGTGGGVRLEQSFPEALQNNFDRVDTIIHALRAAKAGEQNRGPSLLDFAAKNGGLSDQGGELAAMDAPAWHRGAKFRPKLVKEDGRTVGDMSQKAFEAGYFPDRTEAPEPDAFLGAVRDELAGRKMFAVPEDQRRAGFKDAVDQLDQILSQRGIDVAKASNAEIKAALTQHGEDVARSYDQGPRGEFSRSLAEAVAARFPAVKFDISDDGSTARISRLVVPEGAREVGTGSAIMAMVAEAADREGVRVTLSPDGSFGGKPARLREFYKRFGFRENKGRDRSFTTSDAMTRNPPGRVYDQSARGSIGFGEGPAIIKLFEGRDLSTTLHETGHLFLEELRADAARPDAPAQIKADWESVKAHLGVEGDLTTDQHETFARSFEAYLMSGKAPSEGLRGAFQRFRAWLVSIYKQVSALNVPISPEMHDVFDRLLASDSEIASAKDRAGLKIADPKLMGMSDAEAEAYRRTAAAATDTANDALLSKLMAEVRRKRTKEYAEQRERAAGDAEEALSTTPRMHAVEALTGKGERTRLNARDVTDIYGSDTVLDQLPKAVPPVYAREGGVHPDDLAEQTGYRSGEAMLNELMGLEADRAERKAKGDKRSTRQKLVDDETDRLMAERHGDLLNDGSIQEEALAALHNDKAGELLAAELRAVSRKTGAEVTPYQLVKRWAQDHIAERRYADLQPHVFLRAEKKAAGEFEKALVGGNDAEAVAAKQRQMIAHLLYREASDARDASDKITTRLGKLADRATLKSMDQDYLERIHELLEAYDFKAATQRELRRRASLATWLAEQRAAGEGVADVTQTVIDNPPRHYTDLSVSELQGLADAVDNLAHLGRLKKKLLDLKKERDFDDLMEEIESRTDDLHDVARDRTASDHERRRYVREFDAAHLKIETLVDWLDGSDVNGPLNRVLIRPAQDAHLEANSLRDSVLEPLGESYSAIPREVRRLWRNKVDTPELIDPATKQPFVMDRRAVVAMALNSGNESNWRKLTEGYGWDETKAKAVIDRTLTKEEWDFVQASWDHVGKLWPKIASTERALTGVVPEKVEGRSVSTPHGDYAGGYWPAVYDPTRSPELDKVRREDAADLFNRIHANAATSKGYTNARTEFTGAIKLSPESVLFGHLNEVTTRIAYAEYLRSAKRLIESDRFRKVVEDKISPEAYRQFMPWLQRQIGYRLIDPKSLSVVEGFMRQLRMNITTSVAAVNPMVWAEHASAFPQSVSVLGWGKLADGFLGYASNPVGAAQFIYGKSEMMRQRMEETSRDQRDLVDRFKRTQSLSQRVEDKTGLPIGWAARIPEMAHFPVSWINQHIVAFPTWLGGYRGALREGLSEADAVASADKAVRVSHSSGAPMNLAAIQDTHEFQKLTTMFYAYHNTQYQLQRNLMWQGTHAKSAADFAKVAQQGLLLLVATPVIAAMVTGRLRKKDTPEAVAGEIGDEVFRALWGGVAIGRDIANASLNTVEGRPADYNLSPLGKSMEVAWRGLSDAAKTAKKAAGDPNAQPSSRALQNMISAPGVFLGYPLAPVGRAVQYESDVQSGQQHPADVLEHAGGLAFGPPRTAH